MNPVSSKGANRDGLRVKAVCDQCGEQRGIVAMREVCRDCHRWDCRYDDAVHDLLHGAARWLSETGPGMHVNTAMGRGETRQAVDRIRALAAER
jgi:ribosomal protein S14